MHTGSPGHGEAQGPTPKPCVGNGPHSQAAGNLSDEPEVGASAVNSGSLYLFPATGAICLIIYLPIYLSIYRCDAHRRCTAAVTAIIIISLSLHATAHGPCDVRTGLLPATRAFSAGCRPEGLAHPPRLNVPGTLTKVDGLLLHCTDALTVSTLHNCTAICHSPAWLEFLQWPAGHMIR